MNPKNTGSKTSSRSTPRAPKHPSEFDESDAAKGATSARQHSKTGRTNRNAPRTGVDLRAALEAFLLQLEADGRSLHTVGQYRRHIELLRRWLAEQPSSADVADLTPEVIARFVTSRHAVLRPDGRPKMASSLNSLRTSIREFGRFLSERGIVEANPSRQLRLARCSPAPPRALSVNERDRLQVVLESAESEVERRDAALFGTMLATGIRLGSALALDVEDVDFEREELVVRVAKNRAPSRVFACTGLLSMLDRCLGGRRSGPVFLASSGRRLCHRQAQRRFAALAERAGLPTGVRPHDLRHSFASGLYEATGDIGLVRQALGHRSIASTMIYARVGTSRLREAVMQMKKYTQPRESSVGLPGTFGRSDRYD